MIPMANPKTGKLEQHPLVALLRPQPDQQSGVLLTGYVGNSPDAKKRRLYRDLQLNSYVEFSEGDVVSHSPSDPGNPNAPTHLVFKVDAQLKLVAAGGPTSAAAFLRGEIDWEQLCRGNIGTTTHDRSCAENTNQPCS
jgi:hypothetical protein